MVEPAPQWHVMRLEAVAAVAVTGSMATGCNEKRHLETITSCRSHSEQEVPTAKVKLAGIHPHMTGHMVVMLVAVG